MKLAKIEYAKLNARQKEIYNFQKVAALLADYGFNCIKLTDDWQGADFLAYHKDGKNTLKVQLKPRVCVYRKYLGKSLYMAFPVGKDWYLVEHDLLVKLVGKTTKWLGTHSWKVLKGYSSDSPNPQLLSALEFARLKV